MELGASAEVEIPVQLPWIGGVAFKMAPDRPPTPPPEPEPEEDPHGCCIRGIKRFIAGPIDFVDDLITNYNPLDTLERGAAKRYHDTTVRRAVETELGRLSPDVKPKCLGGCRGHWLFS